MSEDRISLETALGVLNRLVTLDRDKALEDFEIALFKAAWHDPPLSYEDIKTPDHSSSYFQHTLGPRFWKYLSQLFEKYGVKDASLSKNSLRKQFLLNRNKLFDLVSSEGLTISKPKELSSPLIGREAELDSLLNLCSQNSVLMLSGPVGIGKTTLVSRLFLQLQQQDSFQVWFWTNLFHLSFPEFANDIIGRFEDSIPDDIWDKISLLVETLVKRKFFIVLDNAECLMTELYPNQRSSYDNYIDFFKKLSSSKSQSCVLLCTSLLITDLYRLHLHESHLGYLKLHGLDSPSAHELLIQEGLDQSDSSDRSTLIKIYDGNPLELKLVASQIRHYCGGSIKKYLDYSTCLYSDRLVSILNFHFHSPDHLPILGVTILVFVANEMNSHSFVSFDDIFNHCRITLSGVRFKEITETIQILENNFLLVCDFEREPLYRVLPHIKDYILRDPLGFVAARLKNHP